MKNQIFQYCFLTSLSIIMASSSCKKETQIIYEKEKPLPVNYSIIGVWQGNIVSYTVDNGYQDYSLFIKPDSTISIEGTAKGVRHYAVGSWSLKDSLFSAQIKTLLGIYGNVNVEQELKAVFHKSNQTLSDGKWINSRLRNDSGYFNAKYVK